MRSTLFLVVAVLETEGLVPVQVFPLRKNVVNLETQQRRNGVVCHGIPKMFRWLTDQYPQIMERISEGLPDSDDEEKGEHVDNLYLDMNGIIHQSTHGNADERNAHLYPVTLKEQFVRIFQFTDKVCKIVKPRKVIYLAVDGIAPRAKMNQQRSRRFRSSMERAKVEEDRAAYGESVGSASFDSNCITPGTEFMYKLTIAFKAWLEYKCKEDPFYAKPLIIFSGADVPGEGEHKVMDYIRDNRDTWNPELRHCFYGLDADLIMLSLVTHQPHFRLLREKMTRGKQKRKDPLALSRYDFELLEVGLLREMIELQFRGVLENNAQSENKRTREERLVDDFVFVCMLVGNDFLPQMPHLDILDGSLDLCLMIYRELAPHWGEGFLSDEAKIHLPRFELFVRALAVYEPKYFARRGEIENVLEFQDPEQYRTYYYQSKFGTTDEAFIRQLVQEYVLGLFWCLAYYQHGCTSWDWFYPYLYAPLASDVVNLVDLNFEFATTNSRPFTPLMQLLSVLPPQSAALLPKPYAEIMNAPGLKDAFPLTFETDPNGKHQPWESVVLIPFLDENTLVSHLSQIDHTTQLTEQERRLNDIRDATEWISPANPDLQLNSKDTSKSPKTTQKKKSAPPASSEKRKPAAAASTAATNAQRKKKKPVTASMADKAAPDDASPL